MGKVLDSVVELLEARAVVAVTIAVQTCVAVRVDVGAVVEIGFSCIRFLHEVAHEGVVVLASQAGALVHACGEASIAVLLLDQVRLDLLL